METMFFHADRNFPLRIAIAIMIAFAVASCGGGGGGSSGGALPSLSTNHVAGNTPERNSPVDEREPGNIGGGREDSSPRNSDIINSKLDGISARGTSDTNGSSGGGAEVVFRAQAQESGPPPLSEFIQTLLNATLTVDSPAGEYHVWASEQEDGSVRVFSYYPNSRNIFGEYFGRDEESQRFQYYVTGFFYADYYEPPTRGTAVYDLHARGIVCSGDCYRMVMGGQLNADFARDTVEGYLGDRTHILFGRGNIYQGARDEFLGEPTATGGSHLRIKLNIARLEGFTRYWDSNAATGCGLRQCFLGRAQVVQASGKFGRIFNNEIFHYGMFNDKDAHRFIYRYPSMYKSERPASGVGGLVGNLGCCDFQENLQSGSFIYLVYTGKLRNFNRGTPYIHRDTPYDPFDDFNGDGCTIRNSRCVVYDSNWGAELAWSATANRYIYSAVFEEEPVFDSSWARDAREISSEPPLRGAAFYSLTGEAVWGGRPGEFIELTGGLSADFHRDRISGGLSGTLNDGGLVSVRLLPAGEESLVNLDDVARAPNYLDQADVDDYSSESSFNFESADRAGFSGLSLTDVPDNNKLILGTFLGQFYGSRGSSEYFGSPEDIDSPSRFNGGLCATEFNLRGCDEATRFPELPGIRLDGAYTGEPAPPFGVVGRADTYPDSTGANNRASPNYFRAGFIGAHRRVTVYFPESAEITEGNSHMIQISAPGANLDFDLPVYFKWAYAAPRPDEYSWGDNVKCSQGICRTVIPAGKDSASIELRTRHDDEVVSDLNINRELETWRFEFIGSAFYERGNSVGEVKIRDAGFPTEQDAPGEPRVSILNGGECCRSTYISSDDVLPSVTEDDAAGITFTIAVASAPVDDLEVEFEISDSGPLRSDGSGLVGFGPLNNVIRDEFQIQGATCGVDSDGYRVTGCKAVIPSGETEVVIVLRPIFDGKQDAEYWRVDLLADPDYLREKVRTYTLKVADKPLLTPPASAASLPTPATVGFVPIAPALASSGNLNSRVTAEDFQLHFADNFDFTNESGEDANPDYLRYRADADEIILVTISAPSLATVGIHRATRIPTPPRINATNGFFAPGNINLPDHVKIEERSYLQMQRYSSAVFSAIGGMEYSALATWIWEHHTPAIYDYPGPTQPLWDGRNKRTLPREKIAWFGLSAEAMPRDGSASYSGGLWGIRTADWRNFNNVRFAGRAPLNIDVDFANGEIDIAETTISYGIVADRDFATSEFIEHWQSGIAGDFLRATENGEILSHDIEFTNVVINGSAFSGDFRLHSFSPDKQDSVFFHQEEGKITGGFFGPNAEEIAGGGVTGSPESYSQLQFGFLAKRDPSAADK